MAESSYQDWTGIAQAIKAAATHALKAGTSSQDVSAQIIQAQHDRFLSRIFADGEQSEWLLKGGTAMLARVPRSRSTTDLDLASATAADLDQAQAALQQAAARDLGDHLRFELATIRPTGRGDNQPGVHTRRMVFHCLDAQTGKKVGQIPIDLVVGPPPVGRVETLDPANRLHLPRPLTASQYRLFPISDQVAEKVCATMMSYNGQPSSRVKDLVDLVTLARTQRINLRELQLAIETKRRLSKIPPFNTFTIPDGWNRPYRALAANTPSAGGIVDNTQAQALARALIDPALAAGTISEATTWVPGTGWTDHPEALTQDDATGGAGDVHVRSHTRSGYPVTEHWRGQRGD